MRTTVSIDDDLIDILKRRSHELGKSYKEVLNAALRKGLAENLEHEQPHNVSVRPHDFGATPGLDMDRLNQLVDELEAEDYLRKAKRDDSPGR